jgi:hypothetical protein
MYFNSKIVVECIYLDGTLLKAALNRIDPVPGLQ